MDFDPFLDHLSFGNLQWEESPFPLPTKGEISGVTFDRHFTLDPHYLSVLPKPKVRRGSLNRVAHGVWGLEHGIVRMTHDAVVTTLLRYAPVAFSYLRYSGPFY